MDYVIFTFAKHIVLYMFSEEIKVMICIVTFKYDIPLEKEKQFFNFFKSKKPKITDNVAGKVCVRNIEYKITSKSVNINRIQRDLNNYNCVLFNENESIPSGLKVVKSKDYTLMKKICINTAVQLSKMKELCLQDLKIALYDKIGESFELTYELLKHIPQLTVVTYNTEMYNEIANTLYYDTGAPLTVTDNKDILSSHNIIISPSRINEDLNLPYGTYVFTSECPSKNIGGTVLYKYNIPVPQRYMDLCPEYIDKRVFTNVLYSVEGLKYLDKEIPISIHTCTGEYSLKDLIKLINKSKVTY